MSTANALKNNVQELPPSGNSAAIARQLAAIPILNSNSPRTLKEDWIFLPPRHLSVEDLSDEKSLSYDGEVWMHALSSGQFAHGEKTFSIKQDTTLLEVVTDAAPHSLLADALTFDVADGATLTHVRLHASAGCNMRRQVDVSIGKEATYKQFTLTAGVNVARTETRATLVGHGGHIEAKHLALLDGEEKADNLVRTVFQTTDCTANIQNRCLVNGVGHGIFQGKFHVEKPAQQTDAYMMCENMLLSDNARVSHKPELEIYADDVKCSHGATTGGLDAEQIFYLRARGLSEAAARRLLVAGQVEEILSTLPADMRTQFDVVAEAWLTQLEANHA